MADIADTLKDLLGDNDKLSGIMGALTDGSSDNAPAAGADMQMAVRGLMKQLSAAGDKRSGLLMSLRPYMKESRQGAIDTAVRLLNILKFAEMFGNGGLNV
ncbi:MAG: hypothetical protein IJH37_08010 [Clostridia bacterium]|nr:hypothetical protein [Clostridia bacterium]